MHNLLWLMKGKPPPSLVDCKGQGHFRHNQEQGAANKHMQVTPEQTWAVYTGRMHIYVKQYQIKLISALGTHFAAVHTLSAFIYNRCMAGYQNKC